MKANVEGVIRDAQRLVQQAGPYVLIELVLPGGTLIALGLYLYRKGHLRSLGDVLAAGKSILRAAGRAFDQMAFVWQPPADSRSRRPGQTLSVPGGSLMLPGR